MYFKQLRPTRRAIIALVAIHAMTLAPLPTILIHRGKHFQTHTILTECELLKQEQNGRDLLSLNAKNEEIGDYMSPSENGG